MPDAIRAQGAPLDFWSYVDEAPARLQERSPDADAEASELLITLNRASTAIVRDLELHVLKAHDLTWSAFRLLHSIWLVGPLEPREVSEVTGMSRALVSSTAKLLRASGLIERSESQRDGRTVLLSLTEAGTELIDQVYREQNARERLWAAALTPAERGLLVMVLRKLARTNFDPSE